ncbi:hypothetical protein AKO1_014740 [Acrasis kona]|uniref:Uncharacterized protein n=1 Tax=Acrasis kona TaxID=1008807 RepID=A0AAW2YLX8_9EUKA
MTISKAQKTKKKKKQEKKKAPKNYQELYEMFIRNDTRVHQNTRKRLQPRKKAKTSSNQSLIQDPTHVEGAQVIPSRTRNVPGRFKEGVVLESTEREGQNNGVDSESSSDFGAESDKVDGDEDNSNDEDESEESMSESDN